MIRLTLDTCLARHNMTRYRLAKETGVTYQIIDKYYKNKVVRYDSYVLDRICAALNCDISEILAYESES